MSLDRLNEKQKEAAMQLEGPILILAGAGSGKTSTMTERIAYMIDQGIDPYRILAVTFTNKAAKEMRERVEKLVGSCDDMWIMTFHSLCLRLLKMHAEVLGYDRNFVIYDGNDQKTVVKNIIKEHGINDKEIKVQYALSVISDKKSKGISPDKFAVSVPKNPKNNALAIIYSEYQETLKKNNAMDFDDLLVNAVKLFDRDEAVLLKYQERFKYIMVDEYQDTNTIQYNLIKALAAKYRNLCVVGDDDQCIYQWRGADIRNILDFEKDFPEAKVIKLEQNYRSVGNILAAAHSVIENNSDRKGKELWTTREAGEKIVYHRTDSEKDEAYFVAREIELLKTGDRKYSDFAVLYRTNAQSRQFEEAFTRQGIPYRVLSGLRYYDRKEIKDIMSYMRLVLNPSDDLAFARIINEPKRGIGAKTIEKIVDFARFTGGSLLDTVSEEMVLSTLPSKAYDGVKNMVDTIKMCREEKENLRVSDIYDNLLVGTGYLASLEAANTLEAQARIENLMEFKSVIFDYEENTQEPTLEEFMESITLMAEVDNHDESQDAVVLMTMHSSKGLEFPVVFLPGMEDGLFPGHKAFDTASGMEEERRLCYVGMTRAKERLILTNAKVRTLYGRTDYTIESQFLRELDKRLVTGDAIYEKKSRNGISGPGISTGSIDGAGIAGKAGYKPYDALKYAKSQTKAAAASSGKASVDYAVGERVKHAKFGEGTVVSTSQKVVVICFDGAGEKKLAKGIAPIEKL